jgi:ElaB/YqjD/DUF883 family membrane-anchored ribosome-binding protein
MSATTQTTLADAAKAAKDNVTPLAKDTIDKVRSDLSSLGDEVRGIIDQVSKVAKTRGEAVAARTKEMAGDATDRFVEVRATTESLIRKHPLAAIGIAVGVGVIVAAMSRKK